MIARSEINSLGFSIKSVIKFSLLIFTTPKSLGFFTFFTKIVASFSLFKLKSALNKVSAKATITFPSKEFSAQKIA